MMSRNNAELREAPAQVKTPLNIGKVHRIPGQKKASAVRTALLLPDELGIDDWKEIGQRLGALADSSCWWLADWLVYGRKKYPDRYRRTIAETKLDYQTLRNYAWVASRFPVPRRRAGVSFQHHAEVAGLPEREQDILLEKAQRLRWSCKALRANVQALRDKAEPEPPSTTVHVKVRIAPDKADRWHKAAELNNATLVEWITEVVDAAVAAVPLDDAA